MTNMPRQSSLSIVHDYMSAHAAASEQVVGWSDSLLSHLNVLTDNINRLQAERASVQAAHRICDHLMEAIRLREDYYAALPADASPEAVRGILTDFGLNVCIADGAVIVRLKDSSK